MGREGETSTPHCWACQGSPCRALPHAYTAVHEFGIVTTSMWPSWCCHAYPAVQQQLAWEPALTHFCSITYRGLWSLTLYINGRRAPTSATSVSYNSFSLESRFGAHGILEGPSTIPRSLEMGHTAKHKLQHEEGPGEPCGGLPCRLRHQWRAGHGVW